MQIVATFARLYWYHKCNLQIAAATPRLTKNAYYKLMLLLQDYTDITNAICKLLLLLQD